MTEQHKARVGDILAQRGSSYGDFSANAQIAQRIKRAVEDGTTYPALSFAHKEAIDLIITKLSRIVCGDPTHQDNWDDVAGYAMLAASRCGEYATLPGKSKGKPATVDRNIGSPDRSVNYERHADRMAKAIQRFRNLGLLRDLQDLRGTAEYADLCLAWEEFDGATDMRHRTE